MKNIGRNWQVHSFLNQLQMNRGPSGVYNFVLVHLIDNTDENRFGWRARQQQQHQQQHHQVHKFNPT